MLQRNNGRANLVECIHWLLSGEFYNEYLGLQNFLLGGSVNFGDGRRLRSVPVGAGK
jgi:hypothetical protein